MNRHKKTRRQLSDSIYGLHTSDLATTISNQAGDQSRWSDDKLFWTLFQQLDSNVCWPILLQFEENLP